MFSKTVQSSLISLFSSTNSNPLILASTSISSSLASDSLISLVNDAVESDPGEVIIAGERKIHVGGGAGIEKGNIKSVILELSSPDIRGTYVAWGSHKDQVARLGITLPVVHLSVKNMNQYFYFEIGVCDDRGGMIIVRVSTFQSEPQFYEPGLDQPALLHLPLRFPPVNDSLLTLWTTITLNLQQILVQSASLIPTTTKFRMNRFASIALVKVHANCRLKRIWFSEDGEETMSDAMMLRMRPELCLFA